MGNFVNKIGVIGLGSMGMGIAQSLIKNNIPTYGFDLNQGACKNLLNAGAIAVGQNAAEFAHEIDALLLVVVNGRQVEAILFSGEQPLVEQLRPGTVIVLHSTLAAEQTKNIAQRLASYQYRL